MINMNQLNDMVEETPILISLHDESSSMQTVSLSFRGITLGVIPMRNRCQTKQLIC